MVEMEGPLKTRSVQGEELARENGDQILASPLTAPHDALTDLLFTLKEARLIAGSLDNGVLIYFLEMAALEARAMLPKFEDVKLFQADCRPKI
jgi:hypothetical protein